jgi:hypothetical protein
MAGMKGVNILELGSMWLAEKLDWKGLKQSSTGITINGILRRKMNVSLYQSAT